MNSREHGKVGAVTSTGRIGYPRTLWLVRHAESAGNVANAAALAEGLPELDLAHRDMDVPLSDRGVLQARALSIWLEGLPELPDRSEEHTSELQSLMRTSYAVFCLKKKKR